MLLVCVHTLSAEASEILDWKLGDIQKGLLIVWPGDLGIQFTRPLILGPKNVLDSSNILLAQGNRCRLAYMAGSNTEWTLSEKFTAKIRKNSTFRLRANFRDSGYLSHEWKLVFNRLPFIHAVDHLIITCYDQKGAKESDDLTLREVLEDIMRGQENDFIRFFLY